MAHARGVTVAAVVAIALACCLSGASASHFAGNVMTWSREPGSLTVHIRMLSSWACACSVGYMNMGDGNSINFGGAETLDQNPTTGYYTQLEEADHTYAAKGSYSVSGSSCCKVYGIKNMLDSSFKFEMQIDLRDDANTGSPIALVPLFIPVRTDRINILNLALSDPDLSDTFQCKMASGSGPVPGLTLNTEDCQTATWDTTGLNVGDRYEVVIDVCKDCSDAQSDRIQFSFLVQIALDVPWPVCGNYTASQAIRAGVTLQHELWVADEENLPLTLEAIVNLPPGATTSVAVGKTLPSPVHVTTTWTPPLGVSGAWAVSMRFSNGQGDANCGFSVTMAVDEDPPILTLLGPREFTWDLVDGDYEDPGATGWDPKFEEDLPVTIDPYPVPPLVNTTWNLTYTVTDGLFTVRDYRTVHLIATGDCFAAVGNAPGTCERIMCPNITEVVDTNTVGYECSYRSKALFGDTCKLWCTSDNLRNFEANHTICGPDGRWWYGFPVNEMALDAVVQEVEGRVLAASYYKVFDQFQFQDQLTGVWPTKSLDPFLQCHGPCLIDGNAIPFGDPHPTNPCLRCRSDEALGRWTVWPQLCRHWLCPERAVCGDAECPFDVTDVNPAQDPREQTNELYVGTSFENLDELAAYTGPITCGNYELAPPYAP